MLRKQPNREAHYHKADHALKIPYRVEMKIAVRPEVRDALDRLAREKWGRGRRRTDLVEAILEEWLEEAKADIARIEEGG